MSMSGRFTVSFQSCEIDSHPHVSATFCSSSFGRPQTTFITGSIGTSKKRWTRDHALLCALPMNFAPMMATFIFFIVLSSCADSLCCFTFQFDGCGDPLQFPDALRHRPILIATVVRVQEVDFYGQEALVFRPSEQSRQLHVIDKPVSYRSARKEIPLVNRCALLRFQVLHMRCKHVLRQLLHALNGIIPVR